MAPAAWGQWVGHPGSPAYSGRDTTFAAAAPVAYAAQPMYPASAGGGSRYGYQPVSPVYAAQPSAAGVAAYPPQYSGLAPTTEYDCEVGYVLDHRKYAVDIQTLHPARKYRGLLCDA